MVVGASPGTDEASTGVHYRAALTLTGAFGGGADPCPVAEERAARQLSLPIHPHLSGEDAEQVAGAVAELAVPAPIS
jgi:dTDP-4-amino-4,6-dideoxygalactose transaminase